MLADHSDGASTVKCQLQAFMQALSHNLKRLLVIDAPRAASTSELQLTWYAQEGPAWSEGCHEHWIVVPSSPLTVSGHHVEPGFRVSPDHLLSQCLFQSHSDLPVARSTEMGHGQSKDAIKIQFRFDEGFP